MQLRESRTQRAANRLSRCIAEQRAAVDRLNESEQTIAALEQQANALCGPRPALHAVELFRLRAEIATVEGQRLDAKLENAALRDDVQAATDALSAARSQLAQMRQSMERLERLQRVTRSKNALRSAQREELELEDRQYGFRP